jgi:hypothetical protein
MTQQNEPTRYAPELFTNPDEGVAFAGMIKRSDGQYVSKHEYDQRNTELERVRDQYKSAYERMSGIANDEQRELEQVKQRCEQLADANQKLQDDPVVRDLRKMETARSEAERRRQYAEQREKELRQQLADKDREIERLKQASPRYYASPTEIYVRWIDEDGNQWLGSQKFGWKHENRNNDRRAQHTQFGEISETEAYRRMWLEPPEEMSEHCEKHYSDDPETDHTDVAHPAYWRGHDYAVAVLCDKINQIIDGVDDCYGSVIEPWKTARQRIKGLVDAQGHQPAASEQRSEHKSVRAMPSSTGWDIRWTGADGYERFAKGQSIAEAAYRAIELRSDNASNAPAAVKRK